MIRSTDRGPELVEPHGRTWRVQPTAETEPIRWLDGEIVRVDGLASGRRLQVREFVITEGSHGYQAFAGILERRDGHMGVLDGATGAFYFFDRDAEAVLGSHLGKPIVAEGYVEGALLVRVVYYRVLAPRGGPH